MDRRNFLKLTGMSMSTLAVSGFMHGCFNTVKSEGSKPNIVLVMADDLGYECLSCYGSASYETPVLDELAATGVQFQHCYSQPLCTPSRIKIMTGKYNFRNYTVFGALDPGEKTFGHHMKDAGYSTCIVGKWQLSARGGGEGTYPLDADFDDYCLWQIDDRESRYADPLLDKRDEPQKTYEGEYGPDIFVDYMHRYIREHQDEPFFVYFPMCLTHDPFVPTPDSPSWEENPNEQDPKYFKDMVEYMDKLMGRIVDTLDETGLRENTLILFTGDNGTHWDIETRMQDGRVIRGSKGDPTDAGTRVPLIANWKGHLQEGAVLNDLVEFTDFLPTMMEAADSEPLTRNETDGRSFFKQLLGKKGDPREWVLIDYPGKGDRWEPSTFVREHRWKLYSDGRLYDIEKDVLEENPIDWTSASHEAQLARDRLQVVLDSYNL